MSTFSCARAHLGQQAPSQGLRRQGGLGLPHSQALQGHGLLGAPLCRFGAGLQLCCARPCLSWATPWIAGPSPKTKPCQAQPSLAKLPVMCLGPSTPWPASPQQRLAKARGAGAAPQPGLARPWLARGPPVPVWCRPAAGPCQAMPDLGHPLDCWAQPQRKTWPGPTKFGEPCSEAWPSLGLVAVPPNHCGAHPGRSPQACPPFHVPEHTSASRPLGGPWGVPRGSLGCP